MDLQASFYDLSLIAWYKMELLYMCYQLHVYVGEDPGAVSSAAQAARVPTHWAGLAGGHG